MKGGKLLEYALIALVCVILISVVFGSILGQPMLLTYVETGSMEPTIGTGDGFIAIPSPIAGEVETGDVVSFQSEEVHGGDLTTHRVVGERGDGYVTQGDANPFTDQDQGEPAVTDGQIQAVALTVNGEVVTIPHLGTAAMAMQSGIDRAERTVAGVFGWQRLGTEQLTQLLFGLGIVFLVLSFAMGATGRERGSDSRTRDRSRSGVIDSRWLLVGCIVLVCAAATLAMVMPAGSETYDIVSTEGDSADPTIIPVGETDSFEYQVHNGGFVPTVSYFEAGSGGIEIEPDRMQLGAQEGENATVTLHAQDETGHHVESMTEYRYLVLLPPSMIDALYEINPWIPYLGIYAVIATPILVFWRLFGGSSDTIRYRSRSRSRRRFDWLS